MEEKQKQGSKAGEALDAVPFSSPSARSRSPAIVPTSRDCKYYVIKGRKKAVIFNHYTFDNEEPCLMERHGTQQDVEAITTTFKSLNWEVDLHTDLPTLEIRRTIANLKAEKDLSALAIFILSHGKDNGILFTYDGQYDLEREIISELSAAECPSLAGKPKLIFVQACQGQKVDDGCKVQHTDCGSGATSTYSIPTHADFLIFQAAFWNHVSYRDEDTGTWFIQALCREIDASQKGENIFKICINVSRRVSKQTLWDGDRKQMPLLTSTLLRKIYLK